MDKRSGGALAPEAGTGFARPKRRRIRKRMAADTPAPMGITEENSETEE
jgi:hypothetical protein